MFPWRVRGQLGNRLTAHLAEYLQDQLVTIIEALPMSMKQEEQRMVAQLTTLSTMGTTQQFYCEREAVTERMTFLKDCGIETLSVAVVPRSTVPAGRKVYTPRSKQRETTL